MLATICGLVSVLFCVSRSVGRQWISQFPAVFEADPLLEQTMGDLWALVRSDGEETQLIDTSCL